MATRRISLQEFLSHCSDFTLCVVHDRSRSRPVMTRDYGLTVSHWHQNLESQEAPRHVQCAARLRPYITAVIFHIKGHNLTLIVRQVGGVLMSSLTNVHAVTDASFLGLKAALSCLCARPPRGPPTPSQWPRGAQMNIRQDVKNKSILTRPNTCRFSDPYILYSAIIPLDSRSIVGKKSTHE